MAQDSLLSRVAEIGGRRLPFLRWSVIRFGLAQKKLRTEWQVGDGREEAALQHVLANAPRGDVNAAIAAIDDFAYRRKFLINVGDVKGAILDRALERAQPRRAMELGAYVGYSALRIARKLPAGGHLYSIEFSAANAAITRGVLEHAGVSDRVTVVHGYLGDQGVTLERLAKEHGFAAGNLDFVFFDHDKDAYLPDLQRLLAQGWLHPGSVLVADNVKFPGAPEYRAFLESQEGVRFRTETHQTHGEYQTVVRDVVLVTTVLG